jgi:hypothetical protein
MGSATSKAQRASRKYPSPSNLPNRSSTTPTQARAPFPPPSQSPYPTDVRAKLEGMQISMSMLNIGMPKGIDPNLAARLQQLGPVSVARPESRIPAKVVST